MLQILALLPKLAGSLLTGLKFLWGDQSKRDEFRHLEAQARQKAYAAEFSYGAAKRGAFDRFMDGINRIPRPLMAFGVIGLMAWCVFDPDAFRVSMSALEVVPTALWGIFAAIIGFYFGGRWAEKSLNAKIASGAVGNKPAPRQEIAHGADNWKDEFFKN